VHTAIPANIDPSRVSHTREWHCSSCSSSSIAMHTPRWGY